MSIDNLQTPAITADDGSTFTPVEITASGIEITNAANERRSDGELIPAGSESVFSVRADTGSVINASYLKAGVIDASLVRTGLLQTVPSWNTKWAGAASDHAAVQMGFTGGNIAVTGVSTGAGTVTLTVASGHGITTSDYIRVSGLYFTTGSLLGSVGLNLPYTGPTDYVQPTATTATTITYPKTDITAGLTFDKTSLPYVGELRQISTISRVFDGSDNAADLSTVTVTTTAAHGFSVGNYVELTGTIETLDGVWYVDTVPSSTTFTFKQRFGEDVEYDGTLGLSLPTFGAPCAIPVKKTYLVNSDGSSVLSLLTVSSSDGNRPGIYITKSTSVGDIAVPSTQVLNFGHWDGSSFTEDVRIDANGNVRIFGGYFAVGPSSYDVFKVNFTGLVTVGDGSNVAGDLRVYGKSGVDGAVRIYGGASTSAGATLSFDSANSRFNMNNDLNVAGGLTTTGIISAGSSISGGTASFGTINASGPINANYTAGTYAIVADDAIQVPEANGIYFGSTSTGRLFYSSTSGFFTFNDDVRVTMNATSSSSDVYIGSVSGLGTLSRFSSARRYKQDIADFVVPLSDVLQLRPVTFRWNPETTKSEDTGEMTGLIAEEVESISDAMKRICRYNEETGEIESVQYSQLPVFLIGAIKELAAKNDALEARIAELEAGA